MTWTRKDLQIVGQFCTTSITRVHSDEYSTRGNKRDLHPLKNKPFSLKEQVNTYWRGWKMRNSLNLLTSLMIYNRKQPASVLPFAAVPFVLWWSVVPPQTTLQHQCDWTHQSKPRHQSCGRNPIIVTQHQQYSLISDIQTISLCLLWSLFTGCWKGSLSLKILKILASHMCFSRGRRVNDDFHSVRHESTLWIHNRGNTTAAVSMIFLQVSKTVSCLVFTFSAFIRT